VTRLDFRRSPAELDGALRVPLHHERLDQDVAREGQLRCEQQRTPLRCHRVGESPGVVQDHAAALVQRAVQWIQRHCLVHQCRCLISRPPLGQQDRQPLLGNRVRRIQLNGTTERVLGRCILPLAEEQDAAEGGVTLRQTGVDPNGALGMRLRALDAGPACGETFRWGWPSAKMAHHLHIRCSHWTLPVL
jgi:hypothetical protein